MLLVTTSTHAILSDGRPNADVVAALAVLSKTIEVGVISNQPEPKWFGEAFEGSEVEFVQEQARQGGGLLKRVAKKYKVPPHKVMVLAATRDDVAMARNGGAMLASAGWSADSMVSKYGMSVATPGEFLEVVNVVDGWSGETWYRAQGGAYSVEAICDVSTMHKGMKQVMFGRAVTKAVKGGGAQLNGLLAIASCVLAAGGVGSKKRLMWGVYPSSQSNNADGEVLSDFGHRLRTSVSAVQMAKVGKPLFWRHTETVKRSKSKGADRSDPTSEIETIHLNPEYRGKVSGRNVVVLDDCTTYGISMAVAAGLLRAARAESVTCLGIGKFGDCLAYHEINVKSDPFKPVQPGEWSHREGAWEKTQRFVGAQDVLRGLLMRKR